MNLAEHYNNLYNDTIFKIKADNCQVDKLIDSTTDTRYGLTLIARPDVQVQERILKFLTDLKAIEPNQYYYPADEIHITVMAIISCYPGFELSQISIADYVDLIRNNIPTSPFQISLRGITASPICVMVQGFMPDDALTNLRNRLRTTFKSSNLEQSIDKRYTIQTAHSTVVRFKTELTHKKEFINILNTYRDIDFGTFTVDSVQLVCNDWYHRGENEKLLHQFIIK